MICFTVGVVGIYRLGSSGSNDNLEASMNKSKKFVRRSSEVVVALIFSAVVVFGAIRLGGVISPYVHANDADSISGANKLLSELGEWCKLACEAESMDTMVIWEKKDWIIARKNEVLRLLGCYRGEKCMDFSCSCHDDWINYIIPIGDAFSSDSCGFIDECSTRAVKQQWENMTTEERATHQDVLAGRGKWSFENWRAR